jgi:hypothetical protein
MISLNGLPTANQATECSPEDSLAFSEQEFAHSAQYCGTEPVGFNVTQRRTQQPNGADHPKHCNLVNEQTR